MFGYSVLIVLFTCRVFKKSSPNGKVMTHNFAVIYRLRFEGKKTDGINVV